MSRYNCTSPPTLIVAFVRAIRTQVYYPLIDLKARLILLTWKSDHVSPLLEIPPMTSHLTHSNRKTPYNGPRCGIPLKHQYNSLTDLLQVLDQMSPMHQDLL